VIAVEELLHTHPFVRLVMQAKDKVPCVVLYTDEQLQDIRRLCCTAPHGQTTVLGFDKTYNLGDIHVTVSIFKNLSVLRTTTGDHPIFAGPMFLHGNSTTMTHTDISSSISPASSKTVHQNQLLGQIKKKPCAKASKLHFHLQDTWSVQGTCVEMLKTTCMMSLEWQNRTE